jgi:hypothetical protein
MKTFLILSILFFPSLLYPHNKINYMDPLDGANYVSTENSITIGFEQPVNLSADEMLNCITITGSESLLHSGNVIICAGNKKIIYKPSIPFISGEKVTVKISGKLLKTTYPGKSEFVYSFYITSNKPSVFTHNIVKDGKDFYTNFTDNINLLEPPQLTVTVNNNPADGYIFLNPFTTASFLIITDKNGSLYWTAAPTWWSGDFKKQPNGYYTYWDGNVYKHMEIDQYSNTVDTFACGNGYFADIHELRVLLNGNAFLMAYDTQTVDMSHIVQGGNPEARVVGLIIQEIDQNKNVIFQWRSWDHFEITDATHENLLSPNIDYVHGNAIEVENDNTILLSSRHLDEITKIDLATGDIVWRWGGKNNQFTFTNDTIGFSHQHAIRRLANGNLIMFDNGNYHTPSFSRAVEYKLDEVLKTATLQWEYRHSPSVYSAFMGYAQRLENGNTFISWGGAIPTVTEVTQTGTVVFEASYPNGYYTYRAYKSSLGGSPVSNHNGSGSIPAAFSLHQNYPNPFNPSTVINYDIPKSSLVEITVFDITGSEVKKIVSAYKQPGSYSVIFDGSNYSSGLYFYRLKADGFTSTQKMILIK